MSDESTPDSAELKPTVSEALTPATAPSVSPFHFSGVTADYFRVWIVNLFLTIVTLGIYSAWAKVRKKRYFYAHTWVANSNFEYHGDPIAILKGRLIAVAAFSIYYAVGHFYPKLAIGIALVLFVAAPWLIVRSMAFNAFNSSYRNIRFRFSASYGDLLRAIWPLGVVILITLFAPDWDPKVSPSAPPGTMIFFALQSFAFLLAYPYAVGSIRRLHANQSGFGGTPMHCKFGIESVYAIYGSAMIVALVVMFAMGLLLAVGVGVWSALTEGRGSGSSFLVTVMFLLIYLSVFALLISFTKSRMGNLVFSATSIGDKIGFVSTLKARELAKLYFTNLLAVTCTVGLAIPWATIRVARYRASALSLKSTESIDDLVGGLHATVAATGEELGEVFSIDLSL